jgi:hypothetical protein
LFVYATEATIKADTAIYQAANQVVDIRSTSAGTTSTALLGKTCDRLDVDAGQAQNGVDNTAAVALADVTVS